MPDAPVIAESSPAAPTVEIPRGSADYAEWRKTGNLPQPKADPAPAKESSDAPAPDQRTEAEPAPASEPESKTQEPAPEPARGKNAESRIKQLLAENKKLKLQIETGTRSPEPAREPAKAAPAQPQPPQNYAEWRKTFNPTQWVEKFGKDNPKASYEEAVAAMNDHLDDIRSGYRQQEQQMAEQQREFNSKLAETRTRYPDMDTVIAPVAKAIAADEKISPIVKALVNDSTVFADLLYVMGSDQAELASLLEDARSNPGAAIRRLVVLEHLVKEELVGKKAAPAAVPDKDPATGKFVKPGTPEKPIADAPPPPTEVSGRHTPPGDAVAEAVKDGDFARYRATRNARDLQSRKG